MSSADKKPKPDLSKGDIINRGIKKRNWPGIATFFIGRAVEPFLQYGLLASGWGDSIIKSLHGTVTPHGAPLVTNTPLDALELSPYRTIILAMAVSAAVKQNYHLLFIMKEEMAPGGGVAVGVFNAVFNSINSLLFICAQTTASSSGESLLQAPLLIGSTMFALGLSIEFIAEYQRAHWKNDSGNKGKVYEGGLFSTARHINYFGYSLWRAGAALATGGWIWAAIIGSWFTYDFTQRGVPTLQDYLEKRYGEKYEHYKKATPAKFVPFLW